MAVLLHSFADDEFLWWKRRFSKKSLQIFQTKNRAKLAKVLDGKFDIILCDDGLEDKRLSESETILLDWGDSARKISDLIPCGKCRSLERDYSDFTFRLSCFGETPDVSFFISSIKPYSIWEKNLPEESSLNEKLSSKKIIAACGIGEPARFALDLKKAGYEVVKEIFSFDHSPYLAQILRKELRHGELPLVITEKDAVRIREKFSSMEKEKLARVFVALQEVSVSSKISEQIFSFTP